MEDKRGLTYKNSGVDIDAQDRALARVKAIARSTFTPGVLSEIGLFGGLFALEPDREDGPVLVASADGVGTKLKVAQMAGRYDTVGQDLVNHCVNDILVQGARPLFFLDYFAAGKLIPERLASVVEGLGKACRENGCALIGGETAEMPGLYGGEDFDLAGFIVGVVERSELLPRDVRPGNVLLGLTSTGLHTNGYSLARRLFFERQGMRADSRVEELDSTVGEALLAVHRSYLRALSGLLVRGRGVTALAHITGGGIPDNLPRVLPEGVQALIQPGSWEEPPLFRYIRREGAVPEEEMRRTFNLGVGMVLCVEAGSAGSLRAELESRGEKVFTIGELKEGPRGVVFA
ncbi:MAG: phosphoribosylformylglycinamidine cyclo-ligase [Acidobacteriota bacterium]